MKEIILCKYGEIILKGANKGHFEALLMKDIRRRAKHIGNFDVRYAQSTVFIEPLDDEAIEATDEMYEQVKKIFGFISVVRAAACEKDLCAILKTAKEYLPDKLAGYRTFKCDAKRSDKSFPLKSPELAAELGGAILEEMPRLKVDLDSPDVTVRVEIREDHAFIHAGQEKGAGGIPIGSSGRGLLLLSGGIDSPVAGYMIARRGMTIDAVYFESIPYTSERAREKVFELAKKVCEYVGRIRVHVISLTEIQEAIRDNCEEDYFTLILRRFMMQLASMVADEHSLQVLVTGESLGQVASQTTAAICCTEIAADRPVLRPLIGMDKEEIITVARKIDTYDTSILPYEDCCTVFTPRHPRTQPVPEKVAEAEAPLDREALIKKAWETRFSVLIEQFK
jgi:thiamine biosynthesis protein ThiI